jgi:hypothetical protein
MMWLYLLCGIGIGLGLGALVYERLEKQLKEELRVAQRRNRSLNRILYADEEPNVVQFTPMKKSGRRPW